MPDVVPRPSAPRGRRSPLVIALAATVVLLAVVIELCARFTYDAVIQLWLMVAAFVVFVPAVLILRRLERTDGLHRITGWLFVVSLVLQVLAVTGPPATSDDDWRYLWDGRVQLHGIDPYRYSVRAHQLQDVRTDTFFPPERPCQYHKFPEDGRPIQDKNGCTRMNRPTADTVYPPVAEAFFAVMYVVTAGGHGTETSMQLAAGIGVLLIGWLLWRRARSRGDPLWWLALWLWCPTVVIEATQNAHIDWLGVLLVTIAITAVPARRAILRGALLGAAIGVKLYPAVVGASMVKRRPVALVLSAAAVFVISYVPHVLAVGTGVVGFLPTYLQQEDYSTGARYLLISLVVTGKPATVVALCILAAAAVWAVVKGDPEHPERTAVVLFGVAMLVATPNNSWYALLLIMLAVLARRPEWLVIGPVMAIYYLCLGHVSDNELVGRWGYIVALLVVVGSAVWRHSRGIDVSDPPRATHPDPAATRPV